MACGGRQKRLDQTLGPPHLYPPQLIPPPGLIRPPFPDGHPGFINPGVNMLDNPMGFEPVMEPNFGPMNEGFGPIGHDFRLHDDPLNGPRHRGNIDYGPMPDMGPGGVMVREYDHLDHRVLGPPSERHMMPEPPEFRAFAPPFEGRHFGPMERECGPTMDRGFGTVGERDFASSSMQCPDQRAVFFGPRTSHGPPDQDIPSDHGRVATLLGHAGWVDTSLPPPGHPDNQMTPRLPGQPIPDPQAGQLDLSVSNKPDAPKKPKLPPKITAKPPPGRFQGIISFIGKEYGVIERDTQKTIHFSFESFWGSKTEMIPGVRVQFTVFKDKDKGKECATDVVVPPGGTEEVAGEILSGVVIKPPECPADEKTRKLTLPKHAGHIQVILLSNEKANLSFTTHDYRPTLLKGDRVQFNVLTDLVTREKRATNIALMPNTFEHTKESRAMGVVMNVKDSSGSIMSEEWSSLSFDSSENLSETELKVMDEVEFTVYPLNSAEQRKAIRVKRLAEGTVTFGKKTREKIAEAMEKNSTRFTMEKGKWKAVTSEVLPQRTVVFEDVGSEQYEGTIVTTLPKASEKTQVPEVPGALPGLLVGLVAGMDRNLQFGSGDVTSEATMMPGDRVQFNICTKRSNKAQRATNIELLPDRLNHSQEKREKGVVMDLRESFGFIQCQSDPQLFFHLKEVLEECKLSLMDEVEFSVVPAATGEGNQAVRVKKLLWSAFTATPKLLGLGAQNKEKKKMTIKLLRDSVNEEMKNLKVKIESYSPESPTEEDPTENLDGTAYFGNQEVGGFIPPTSENYPVPVNMDGKGNGVEFMGQEESSPSAETPTQGKETGDGRSGAHGGSDDSSRANRGGKYRSPPREHGRKRGHSRSAERGSHYERRHRRSRSRSRERSRRSGRGRSRSREREDSYSRRHGSSRESTNRGRRRSRSKSRSPNRDSGTRRKIDDKSYSLAKDKNKDPVPKECPKPISQELPRSENILDVELSRKKRELEELEENIARKRAIMAMAQKGLALKGQSNNEQNSDCDPESGFRLAVEPKSSPQTAAKPAPVPMKSILKKRSEPFVDFCEQSEIPKNLPREPNLGSQSHFAPPSVAHPPFLQTSDKESSLDPPPNCPPLNKSVPRHDPFSFPPQSHKLPFHHLPVCYSPPNQQAPAKSTAPTQFKEFRPTQSVSQHDDVRHTSHTQSAVRQPPFDPPPVSRSPPSQQAHAKDSGSARVEGMLRTHSLSQREPVAYPLPSESAARQPTFDQSSTSHIPQSQTAPAKSTASTQFERFLRTLNKGVDPTLLSSLVKEAKEQASAHEAVESRMSPKSKVLNKGEDQHEESHETTKEPDDFLLPHERAFLDGGGFSRIVGMKHGVGLEESSWKEGDVEDEERFLYGEASDDSDHGNAKVGVDKSQREPTPTEEPKPTEDKRSHFDNLQTLLQTIGLDLDLSEVSRLKDRTQERLYGKKQKSPEQVDRESGKATSRSSRHRSRTDSSESDRTRSISPAQTSRREVYMSYQGALEHSGLYDKEKISAIVKMIRGIRDSTSPSHSTPPSSSSSSKYSHAHNEPHYRYKNASEREPSYSQHGHAMPAGWNQVLLHPEVTSSSAVSQHPRSYSDPHYQGSYVDPHYSGSYATQQYSGSYATPQYSVSYALPQPSGSYVEPPSTFVNHSLPNVPLASPPGLLPVQSSPQFISPPPVQPPPNFAGTSTSYPVNPLTGAPIQSIGSAAFPNLQSVSVEGEKEPLTAKTRCLRVIQTVKIHGQMAKTVTDVKEMTVTSQSSAPDSTEKKQVMTISEDDIKAKQKKRLEQFNERMKQKNQQQREAIKQQREALKSRGESQKIPPEPKKAIAGFGFKGHI